MKKVTNTFSIIIQITLIGMAVIFAGTWLLGRYGLINPIFPFVVLSGSMEPSIKTGSVVFIQAKPFGYLVGDTITYSRGGSKDFTTHRVASLIDQNGTIAYTTKGDANNAADPTPVTKSEIKGAVFLTLPYLGYAVSQAKTPYGFILLVIIPATIIIYEELKGLKHETVKMITKKKTKKKPSAGGSSSGGTTLTAPSLNFVRTYKPVSAIKVPASFTPASVTNAMSYLHADKINTISHPLTNLPPAHVAQAPPPPARKPRYNAPIPPARSPLSGRFFMQAGVSRLSVVIPVAAAAMILVGVSNAYLSDQETAVGNVLGAGTWALTPTLTPVIEPTVTPTPTP